MKDMSWGQPYILSCSVFLVVCADFYHISIAFGKSGKTKEDFEKYKYILILLLWVLMTLVLLYKMPQLLQNL